MEPTIPHIAMAVNKDNIETSIRDLMTHVRPQWPAADIKIKRFDQGLTNLLFGVGLGTDQGPYENDDMVLVRISGKNEKILNTLIDRARECRTMVLLEQHKCGKPIFASFDNGLCYGFVPGKMFSNEMMSDPKYSVLVAKQMARMHTIPVPESYSQGQTPRPCLIESFPKLLDFLPEKFDDPAKNELYKQAMTREELQTAMDEIEQVAATFQEPLVLCHNDLLERNLIYCDREDRVYFIDNEFAGLNYAAVDMAAHFLAYVGIDSQDFSKFPSEEQQLKFIRIYLEECRRHQGTGDIVTDLEVQQFYQKVNVMMLIVYLFWGVWCTLQADMSPIDFPYLDGGILLMGCYRQYMPVIMDSLRNNST